MSCHQHTESIAPCNTISFENNKKKITDVRLSDNYILGKQKENHNEVEMESRTQSHHKPHPDMASYNWQETQNPRASPRGAKGSNPMLGTWTFKTYC